MQRGAAPPLPPQQKLQEAACKVVVEIDKLPEQIKSFRKGLVEFEALVQHHPDAVIPLQEVRGSDIAAWR